MAQSAYVVLRISNGLDSRINDWGVRVMGYCVLTPLSTIFHINDWSMLSILEIKKNITNMLWLNQALCWNHNINVKLKTDNIYYVVTCFIVLRLTLYNYGLPMKWESIIVKDRGLAQYKATLFRITIIDILLYQTNKGEPELENHSKSLYVLLNKGMHINVWFIRLE